MSKARPVSDNIKLDSLDGCSVAAQHVWYGMVWYGMQIHIQGLEHIHPC